MISRNWATTRCLVFYALASELSWSWWVCHLAYTNVLQLVCNEAQGLLEAKSSAILGVVAAASFSHVLRPYHSFKGGALPSSLLFPAHLIVKPPDFAHGGQARLLPADVAKHLKDHEAEK